jgi:hypothetical protein
MQKIRFLCGFDLESTIIREQYLKSIEPLFFVLRNLSFQCTKIFFILSLTTTNHKLMKEKGESNACCILYFSASSTIKERQVKVECFVLASTGNSYISILLSAVQFNQVTLLFICHQGIIMDTFVDCFMVRLDQNANRISIVKFQLDPNNDQVMYNTYGNPLFINLLEQQLNNITAAAVHQDITEPLCM